LPKEAIDASRKYNAAAERRRADRHVAGGESACVFPFDCAIYTFKVKISTFNGIK
jgi:hypothetical protein